MDLFGSLQEGVLSATHVCSLSVLSYTTFATVLTVFGFLTRVKRFLVKNNNAVRLASLLHV